MPECTIIGRNMKKSKPMLMLMPIIRKHVCIERKKKNVIHQRFEAVIIWVCVA